MSKNSKKATQDGLLNGQLKPKGNTKAVNGNDKKANQKVNNVLLNTSFISFDGKPISPASIGKGYQALGAKKTALSNHILAMGQTFGDSEFQDIDRNIRLKMKWGKGKGKTPADTNYKNAISAVNVARKAQMDLSKFTTMYGEGGLVEAYKALKGKRTATRTTVTNEHGDAVQVTAPAVTVSNGDAIAKMPKELQAIEGALLQLARDLETCPIAELVLEQITDEFDGVLERARLLMVTDMEMVTPEETTQIVASK